LGVRSEQALIGGEVAMEGCEYDLSINRWQRRIAYLYFRRDDYLFLYAVEGLMKDLMQKFGEDRWCDGGMLVANFDGIALYYTKRQVDFFAGYGIQHLLGGTEPIVLKFWFNSATRRMTSAVILFGMQRDEISHRSYGFEDTMLAMALGARQRLKFEWEYEFTLADGKWS
jgi:hypothetical protein